MIFDKLFSKIVCSEYLIYFFDKLLFIDDHFLFKKGIPENITGMRTMWNTLSGDTVIWILNGDKKILKDYYKTPHL